MTPRRFENDDEQARYEMEVARIGDHLFDWNIEVFVKFEPEKQARYEAYLFRKAEEAEFDRVPVYNDLSAKVLEIVSRRKKRYEERQSLKPRVEAIRKRVCPGKSLYEFADTFWRNQRHYPGVTRFEGKVVSRYDTLPSDPLATFNSDPVSEYDDDVLFTLKGGGYDDTFWIKLCDIENVLKVEPEREDQDDDTYYLTFHMD